MSKFNCTERDKIVKRYIRRKIHRIHCRNFQAMFTIFHYASRVSFLPPILKSFRERCHCVWKTRNPGWIKKFFRRDINQLGILDVGWQRSHGPLNIFSVCLSRAKISRSSRRDLLQKKRKKKIRALPCFFLPHSSIFPLSPRPRQRRILTGILASNSASAPVIPIFHTTRRRPSSSSWLRVKR